MYFSVVKSTIYNNYRGVLNSVLPFGLHDKVKSNVRMYFYKFNVYDLIEIQLNKDYICVYEFNYTGSDRVEKIKNDLEFYVGYFKSAGLEEKRFLFNIALMLPVSYIDFEPLDFIDFSTDAFAFVLDKSGGYVYGESAVNVFGVTERTKNLDKCVLSFFNSSINTKSPLNVKGITTCGCVASSVIAGLSNGIDRGKIVTELELVDVGYKFVNSLRDTDYNSSSILSIRNKLKVDKFSRVIKNIVNDNVVDGKVIEKVTNGEVKLSDIILVGLDKFAKVLTSKDAIKVNIDCEYNTIRSAYIVDGTMFITPLTMMHLSYFIELLNSENVEFVIN